MAEHRCRGWRGQTSSHFLFSCLPIVQVLVMRIALLLALIAALVSVSPGWLAGRCQVP